MTTPKPAAPRTPHAAGPAGVTFGIIYDHSPRNQVQTIGLDADGQTIPFATLAAAQQFMAEAMRAQAGALAAALYRQGDNPWREAYTHRTLDQINQDWDKAAARNPAPDQTAA